MLTNAGPAYESPFPYEPSRIRAAAIYCSDGRLGVHFDDFLFNCLQLPRYDRLVLPGGAACLVGHFRTYREGDMLMEHLSFLVEYHDLRRVVIMAHENCAYYTERLRSRSLNLPQLQRNDLRDAAQRISERYPHLRIDAYFAQPNDDRVLFEAVEIAPAG